MVSALFLWGYLPHNWDYLLCLTVGSILCATDPVAVVALLKDLGASPTLTVQIQGEALLNDGTAIVLFRISYNMFKDIIYEPSDVIIELVWAGMCAIAALTLFVNASLMGCSRLCSLVSSRSLSSWVMTSGSAIWVSTSRERASSWASLSSMSGDCRRC